MLTQQKRNSNREQLVDRLNKPTNRAEEALVMPPVDIFESDHEVVIELEMAGASKDTIHTAVDGDTLEITGKISMPDLPEEYTPLYSERRKLQYKRAFTLGAEVQKDRIRAQYDNGLLRLTLPKAEKPKPKIVAIE